MERRGKRKNYRNGSIISLLGYLIVRRIRGVVIESVWEIERTTGHLRLRVWEGRVRSCWRRSSADWHDCIVSRRAGIVLSVRSRAWRGRTWKEIVWFCHVSDLLQRHSQKPHVVQQESWARGCLDDTHKTDKGESMLWGVMDNVGRPGA